MKHGLWIACVPLLLSANPLTELITLSQQNEQVTAARMDASSAKASLEAVKNSYLPSLSLGSSYTNTSHERLAQQDPKNAFSASATLSYTLYDGGLKDARIEGAKKSFEASGLIKKATDNQLALQTVSLYFTLLSLQTSLEAKSQHIEQLKADLERLEKFALAGTATKDEVEKIRADLARTQTEKSQIVLNFKSTQFDLEELTGQFVTPKKGASIKEPAGEKRITPYDIQATERSVEALQYVAQGEKAALRPYVSVQDTYAYYDRDFEPESSGNGGSYKQNKLMLSVQWKIFDFGAAEKSYEASRLSFESSRAKLQLAKRESKIRYAYSLEALELAKETIASSEARLKSANVTFDAIAKKFRAGIVNNVTYLDALTDKYEALAALNNAHNTYEIRKAEFYYYAGLEIKEMIR